MKKKLIIVVPVVLLVVVGAVYKLVLAPKPAPPPPSKVEGDLVPLATEFVVNLAGGHYGKVSVALLMTNAPPAPAEGTPPTLEQNAVIRATITDELTGIDMNELIVRKSRRALVGRLEKALKERTDEPVEKVLLTDIAVQ
jgi:flagellar basal body-associated protein FliL